MRIADLRFLIVEDHDFQRRALVMMIANLGAKQIAEAVDGQTALDIFRNSGQGIDIAIIDLEMPGMDGLEFLRHLGEADASLSIIIASALDRPLLASVETMAATFGITLLGVIEKPATPDKLDALIKRYKAPAPRQSKATWVPPVFTLAEIDAGLKYGEFEPFFQPKVAIANGQVKGAEALARWRHPVKGIVAPGAFIKQLEDGGLINELTWIMLEKAATFCGTWRAAGLEGSMSVNLSLASLAEPGLADRITELVRRQSLDPRDMILEVTESAVATNIGNALENLARLRMRGFGLSIDDYGTGYSSMQQLMRISFTELKIDQSFVMNAARHDSSRVILESSLDMARKLKITAVAEGVETREDWDLLRDIGCELAQGYLIAKPMEASAYMNWVRNWMSGGAPHFAVPICPPV